MSGGPETTKAAGGDTEQGFTIAAAMWVMAVTLVLVTGFADLFVQRYAQAVIRQATDEGARAWAVQGGTADDCLAAANDAVEDLLGGPMAAGITFSCSADETTVQVTASATLRSLPPLPDAQFATTSVVARELDEDGLVAP
ncbi:MAG: hypothetical protein OEW29_00490 [Acidimicrobiia bacterium]|nr:hypothetical protein [Acidimicrobiia bacterium]